MKELCGAVEARAKINLFLHVGARREDGFHPLQSLAVFPMAGDRLKAEAADELSLSLEGPFAAALAGDDNLVLKAARALAERTARLPQARLTLDQELCRLRQALAAAAPMPPRRCAPFPACGSLI